MLLFFVFMNSGTSIQRRLKGLAKSVRYKEVSLYGAPFSYVLLHCGKENRSLYQGLRYIEIHYIMVSLNLDDGAIYGLPHTWSITHISHVPSHFT